MSDTWIKEVHARLRRVFGDNIVYRDIAVRFGMNPETVRRQMNFGKPSVQFLLQLARHYDVDLHWLMTGEGPVFRRDLFERALEDADSVQVLEALKRRLAELDDDAGAGNQLRTTEASSRDDRNRPSGDDDDLDASSPDAASAPVSSRRQTSSKPVSISTSPRLGMTKVRTRKTAPRGKTYRRNVPRDAS